MSASAFAMADCGFVEGGRKRFVVGLSQKVVRLVTKAVDALRAGPYIPVHRLWPAGLSDLRGWVLVHFMSVTDS